MIIQKYLSVMVILSNLVSSSDAANILCIYLTPLKSHHIVFKAVTEELLKYDHNIVVVTTDPVFKNTPPNITEIDLHVESYKIWRKQKIDKEDSFRSQLKTRIKYGVETFSIQYNSHQIQNLIKGASSKFDLILIDGVLYSTLYFSHIFKVPVIPIHCTGIVSNYYKNFGHLIHVKYYPGFVQKRIYNLTFWEVCNAIYENLVMEDLLEESEKDIQQLNSSWPPLNILYDDIPLMLVNIHPVWEGIRPNPQRLFYVDALQCKPGQYLSQRLQEYLDLSKNGVIYMSFGTGVVPSTLPNNTIAGFMKAFAQLPYDVLWRWDKEEMPGKPDNVRLFKWLPQADVLRNPKIKLFITQGGQHSTDEAIDAGVPLIGIPIIFDQFANAEKYVRFGIGKRLDFNTVTQEEFKKTIETVIGDKSYYQNIIKLRTLLRDKPMTSMDKTMWAIDYVLRHGGAKHLQSPSANLTWGEYFELELLFSFLAICVTVLCLFVKTVLIIKVSVFRLIGRTGRRDVKIDGKIL